MELESSFFFCPIDGWMEPLKALNSEIIFVCKIVFQEEHYKFGISVKGGLKARKQHQWDVRAFKESDDLNGDAQDMIWGEAKCAGMGACEGNANGMWSFLTVAVRKLLGFHGLKQHKCIILEFWRSESEVVLSRLVQSVIRAMFLCGVSGEEIYPLTFPDSVGCPHHLACGPFLIFRTCSCILKSLILTCLPQTFCHTDSCDYIVCA